MTSRVAHRALRSGRRTTALALAVVSVPVLLAVTSVALAAALRDPPAPSAPPAPYAGWQTVEGDGASYRVPADWELHPPDERVGYRDDAGRVRARGAALSTYRGNDCPGGVRHPGAWAALADPVRARDTAAVATAAARQWARGFGTSDAGTARTGRPRVATLERADGRPAVAATVTLDLHGLDNPCGEVTAELSVVAARDGAVVRLLVLGRHPDVAGAVDDARTRQILRSLT